MNIRCSNRCANPVRFGSSRAEPTWYHMLTLTIGTRVILVEDHAQPVRQRELRVRQLDFRWSGRRLRRGRRGEREKQKREDSALHLAILLLYP